MAEWLCTLAGAPVRRLDGSHCKSVPADGHINLETWPGFGRSGNVGAVLVIG